MRKLDPHEIDRPDAQELASLPRHPIVIVLDDIRSAHNVGSIFRTSDAIRAEKVICCGLTPTPEHHAVAKTALGAEQMVPWESSPNILDALSALKDKRYTLVALEQTDRSILTEDLPGDTFPLALILGNEVTGVQQHVLDMCDYAIELPQFGGKASLNVSVAYGVAAYALMRLVA